MLSNKIPHGEQDANNYYIGYLSGGLRPLHIIIKNIKSYTNRMNILANEYELLKYIKIWNKIEALLNKKFNKKGLYSKSTYNNEYINTKINPYNEKFHGNTRLIKDEYYGLSILLLKSICGVKNKDYPQTFLDKFFLGNTMTTM